LRAQALLRVGDRAAACEQFAIAARDHAAQGSANASICAANAVALADALGNASAAAQLSFESLSFAEGCDLQQSTLQYAFKAALAQRDTALLIAVTCAGSRFASTRELCLRTLLDIARQPQAYGIPAPPAAVAPLATGLLSLVVCSVDDRRFARFERECAQAMPAGGFELIRISDATSMRDGYARGQAQARGAIIAFCHDDIEFLSPDLPGCLATELAEVDVLVSVGGRSLIGPTWFSCGPLGLQGWMAAPLGDGYSVGIAGVPDRRVGLVTGDGCFIAMSRATAQRLGWESTASTGFHLYDLDICARAADAGLSVGATRLIALNHLSGGNYGDAWRSAAQRFLVSRGIEGFVTAPNAWISAPAGGRAEASRILSALATLVPRDWHESLARVTGAPGAAGSQAGIRA